MSTRVDAGDGRRRQSKRDDLIRRKLEQELSKRKNRISMPATNVTPQSPAKIDPKTASAASQGSVMALKPLAPVTMPWDTLVLDAAQYMTALRASCVLVLDEDGSVCGIFTAKDLAFKVVAQQASRTGGPDLRRTLTVMDIMTPDPLCADVSSSATDALNTMVTHGFRHLPLMDASGEIAGVLDITKCFFEAMTKLERAVESSQRLRDALEGVNSELGSVHPQKIMSYVEALKEHTSGPLLESVVDNTKAPISIDSRSTVAEAAIKMRDHHTTAILVMDRGAMVGIFTTKDIVLRVLAANADPARCSMVRVMTPNPECAPFSMNVQAALRKMHDGHFLNLPVQNADGEVVSIVDVLRLTYATLEHLNSMTSAEAGTVSSTAEAEEGPAWNKFWMSLDNDADPVHKVYPHGFEDLDATSSRGEGASDSVSDSELAQFSLADAFDSESILSEAAGPPVAVGIDDEEVRPEDSLSRLGISSPLPETAASGAASTFAAAQGFSMKFRAPSGRAHRILVQDDTPLTELRALILAKLSANDLTALGGADAFAVSYVDDDKDVISVTTEADIRDAVEVARRAGGKRAEIYLHHPDQTPVVRPRAAADASNENGMVPMLVGSAAAVVFGLLAWGKK